MISCQFALYPLGTEHLGPAIDAAVSEMRSLGLEVDVGSMGTQVTGESDTVFEGLRRAFEAAANQGHVVMTVTVSNACPLPEGGM
jgi:uncharacterized protein YqgV (UPF0045/DUF77 family)